MSPGKRSPDRSLGRQGLFPGASWPLWRGADILEWYRVLAGVDRNHRSAEPHGGLLRGNRSLAQADA